MLSNYLKLAWRNLLRNKSYAFINIIGLAIGLSAFLVILLYVDHETSYDNWHPLLKRVYRLGIQEENHGEMGKSTGSPYPLGDQLAQTAPGVAAVTRVVISGERIVSTGTDRFYESKIISADSSFFSVFPYTFVYGNPQTALHQPAQAVISLETSRKLFGNSNPLGRLFKIQQGDSEKEYTVSGVIEKKGPSHLDFNFCLSSFNSAPGNWGRRFYTTYVLLQDNASITSVTKRAEAIYLGGYSSYLYGTKAENASGSGAVNTPAPAGWLTKNGIKKVAVFFEPVGRIHLDPVAVNWRGAFSWSPVDDYSTANRTPVLIFSLAGVLILLLASINYTNLSIAQAGKRAKETGVRKVLGSSRAALIFQFMAEAVVQCTVALFVALCLTQLALGVVNTAFNLQLTIWNPAGGGQNGWRILQFLAIVLVTALVSGSYPAFFLSRYRPSAVLRGDAWKGVKGKFLRNSLIVLQFTIAMIFISGMLIIYRQLNFMHTNDPGFNAAQVLSLKVQNSDLITPGQSGERSQYIRSSLLEVPGVQDVAISNSYPGEVSGNIQFAYFEGDSTRLTFNAVDFNYFRLFHMKVIAGRDFSSTIASDGVDNALLNETAVRKMNLKDPIGKTVNILLRNYRVIGILKDNLNDGYLSEVQPSIYTIGAAKGMLMYDRVLVKVDSKRAGSAAAALTKFWQTVEPAYPLRYEWVDEHFAALLQKHERTGKLAMSFALISLFIAMMGIFALTAFTAGQRRKEIGIRKVFGASVSSVTALLSKDFLKLVTLAILIASPVSWWIMNFWLENFAYRIPISGWTLFLAGAIALVIAALTVTIQAVKAALSNPVESLAEGM